TGMQAFTKRLARAAESEQALGHSIELFAHFKDKDTGKPVSYRCWFRGLGKAGHAIIEEQSRGKRAEVPFTCLTVPDPIAERLEKVAALLEMSPEEREREEADQKARMDIVRALFKGKITPRDAKGKFLYRGLARTALAAH